jgi:hypothetical protein
MEPHMESREEKTESIQGLDQEMQEINESLRGKNEGGSRGSFLKRQINEVGNEDTVRALEQVFATKLALVRSYQRKLATVQDPYARKVLQRMIQEEKNHLASMADLIDLVQKGPEMGPLARTRAKMGHQMRSTTGRNVALGFGLAVLGMVLYPAVKERVRPMVAKAFEGVMDLADQAQNVMAGMKEDFEDIVSEAQFERFKDMADPGFADADFELGPDFDPTEKQ